MLRAAELRTRAAPEMPSGPAMVRLALPAILIVALVTRLLVGMLEPLDGDEAAQGISAIEILHGHFPLVESGGHYLGAVQSYALVPFVALFGATELAIRLAGSVIGAIYVLAMYALGRQLFRRPSAALVTAGLAAVFPFFAVAYGVKGRTYGILALAVALSLLLAIRLGRPARRRWYDWAAFGLVAGIGMWNHPMLALTLLICVLMLSLALRRQGFGRSEPQGLGLAIVCAAVGFGPWIAYAVATRGAALTVLTHGGPQESTLHALKELFSIGIPLLLGTEGVGACGRETLPWPVGEVAFIALVACAIWLRRRSVLALLQLRWSRLAPIDWVILLLPLSLLAVTLGSFRGGFCEPRYLMPAAIPLVAIVALGVVERWAARPLVAVVATAWIGMTAITAANAIQDRGIFPFFDHPTRVDLPRAITAMEQERPGPLWANYWLARPLQYLSDERLQVGEYKGFVGFPQLQAVPAAAPAPGWIFLGSDPDRVTFEQACTERGITYDRMNLYGLVLYDHLSARLTPDELGWSTTTNGG